MKNKILSVLASCALVATLGTTTVLAEDEFLPDVEDVYVELIDEGVELTWSLVEGADMYTVYYGTQSISEDGANYESSVLLEDISEYIFTDLSPDTEYYFAVAADDSTGVLLGSYNYSEEITITTSSSIFNPVEEEEEPVDVEEIHFSSDPEPTSTPDDLPKSGPAAGALILLSSAGAYVYRKFKK